MKRSFLVTTLVVATLSVNVLAMQAQAGTTGLKPSANQGSQSSTNTTTNKEVQSDIQYDTGKYQYPAQQLMLKVANSTDITGVSTSVSLTGSSHMWTGQEIMALLQMSSQIITARLKTMFL